MRLQNSAGDTNLFRLISGGKVQVTLAFERCYINSVIKVSKGTVSVLFWLNKTKKILQHTGNYMDKRINEE